MEPHKDQIVAILSQAIMAKFVKRAEIVKNSFYGLVWYAHEYGTYWLLPSKYMYKHGSPMENRIQNFEENKNDVKNKSTCEILAISFMFWSLLRPKMALLEAALLMSSQILSL